MEKKIGRILVVGAGIGGIRAAVDLAECGYFVTLIDRKDHMGGILSQLDYQFPTDRCGMCRMLPLIDRDTSSQYCLRRGLFHENIDILLSSSLVALEGEAGNFTATIRQTPNLIDPQRCIGCGLCETVCPVELPDSFNEGLGVRKAVYLPVPHMIPNAWRIDETACTRCGACKEVCPVDAIRLTDPSRENFRILVVDDELIVRDSLKEWLEEEAGFTNVAMAGSGTEALAYLETNPCHLMLLDIKMPGMDGVEVLKQAKAIHPDIQVVMMTAYATVDTAVEAMKIGALDYLIKPFDPATLIPKILEIHQSLDTSRDRNLSVGAVVLCTGSKYFCPDVGKDIFAYHAHPDVVTGLEFERILSGTGPASGKLVKISDGKPVNKIAWIQCVGSRDLQTGADFCSSICCMFAIKEARLAVERAKAAGQEIDATIFYMDLRTFGKSFQRYADAAKTDFCNKIRMEKKRVHSVAPCPDGLMLTHMDDAGNRCQERFDMVVLSVGQRPSENMTAMSEMLGIKTNPWGFIETEPFSLTRTEQKGIFIGSAGLMDISESVTRASAAALDASSVVHSSGGGLSALSPLSLEKREGLGGELPHIMVVICSCGNTLNLPREEITKNLKIDPDVAAVVFIDQVCTAEGWNALKEQAEKNHPNRILIGACIPYVYARKLKALGQEIGLDPRMMEVVDIRGRGQSVVSDQKKSGQLSVVSDQKATDHSPMTTDHSTLTTILQMALARLKKADIPQMSEMPVHQKALVVGGGIAGMTCAISIAAHGFQVDLVEQNSELGGNLLWLKTTIEGYETAPLLNETIEKVKNHPQIRIHTNSRVAGTWGQAGNFYTAIENKDGKVEHLAHGVTILATGGNEAKPVSYGFGAHKSVITQKMLEQALDENTIDLRSLKSVVMIQCADSREEPKNYCSRVCCSSALKHALKLIEQNPDIAVYIFYRDIMAYGFVEHMFTKARSAGVIFIPYRKDQKPVVTFSESQAESLGTVKVTAYEPVLRETVEIEADMLVLSAGVVPNLPADLPQMFGASTDIDGFFKEADSKWRPVDSMQEGVFACGLALRPGNIAESITTAQAAAQRSLRILTRKNLPVSNVTAGVRHSLCSLCERCIEACGYGARILDIEQEKIVVLPALCQGCGACAAACPNGASYLEGFRRDQMLDVIDAALG